MSEFNVGCDKKGCQSKATHWYWNHWLCSEHWVQAVDLINGRIKMKM